MYTTPEPSDLDISLVPVPDPAPPPSPGLRLGMMLLWLCFGLPASAVVFLGIPAVLARVGVERLEAAGVPIEIWSELEPWVALAVVMALVNESASFAHRRALPSAEERAGRRRLWFVLGGLNYVAWRGLLVIELVPRTDLHPLFHYLALSGLMVWGSATLAWVSGRVVSFVFAPVERLAMRAPVLRGGLATAGPLSLVGVLAVGGTVVELDGEEIGAELQGLIDDNFKDEWSLEQGEVVRGALGSGGGGARTQQPPEPPKPPDDWWTRCINTIYRGPPHPTLYERGVAQLRSFEMRGLDAESAAADAAVTVCSREAPKGELSSYYFKSVKHEAIDGYHRDRRSRGIGRCPVPSHEQIGIPRGESAADCVFEKLCQMSDTRPDDHAVLMLELTGHSDKEIARHFGIKPDAAKKRRQRAEQRLREFAQECVQ